MGLRWRSEHAVQEIANVLAWQVVADLRTIVPISDLAISMRHALLDELRSSQQLERDIAKRYEDDDEIPLPVPTKRGWYGVTPAVARMLDWLIRHHPDLAAATMTETIGEAERKLGIHRDVTIRSLEIGLGLDSKLADAQLDPYLEAVSQQPVPCQGGAGRTLSAGKGLSHRYTGCCSCRTSARRRGLGLMEVRHA